MELVEIFKTLVNIPSPSLSEEKVADKIIEILTASGVRASKDGYGNVYASIDPVDSSKPSLLLSSHMDVVGDETPVKIVANGDFIETDKTRTLGADDKAGCAAIVKLMCDVMASNFIHGGLEAVFTRDEENSMTGIEHVEFNKLKSEYILVLDSDKLGNFEIAGAGYLKLTVAVKTPFGGHSGLDIGDNKRLNAPKLIAEIIEKIPQGVYKKDETGTVTSINLGSIIGGGVENAVYQAVKMGLKGPNIVDFIAKNSMSNLINTQAFAHYSLRSSDNLEKERLLAEIKTIISEFNEKYGELAKAELEIEEHLPIFEKSDDPFLTEIARRAAQNTGVNLKIQSFHAGAETHIYANKLNAAGRRFKPVLAGVADVYNMHSSDEKIDVPSYKKGYEFLTEFFRELQK